MPTICFVRHGLVHNPEQVYYGRLPGFFIGNEGLAQAKLAGEWLARQQGLKVREIRCSPMLRARQTTGAILAEMLGSTATIAVTVTPDLNEVHSRSDGMKSADIERIGWDSIYDTEPGQGFETFPEFYARVAGVIKMIAGTATEDTICVTHGDVCLCAHMYARQLPGTAESKALLRKEGFYPQTASVISMSVDPEGAVLGHSYTEAGTGEGAAAGL